MPSCKIVTDAIARLCRVRYIRNPIASETMNPARRVLLQVTVDDAAQADELFSGITTTTFNLDYAGGVISAAQT